MNVRESGSSQHSIPSTLPTVGDCRCEHATHIPCERKIQYICMTTSTIVHVRSTGARQGLTLKEEPATGLMVRMSRFGGGWNGCRMDMQPTVDSSCSMMAAPSPSRPLAGPLATLSAGRTSCNTRKVCKFSCHSVIIESQTAQVVCKLAEVNTVYKGSMRSGRLRSVLMSGQACVDRMRTSCGWTLSEGTMSGWASSLRALDALPLKLARALPCAHQLKNSGRVQRSVEALWLIFFFIIIMRQVAARNFSYKTSME